MENKILLFIMSLLLATNNNAASSEIPADVAMILADAAGQVNDANERADQAKSDLAKYVKESAGELARASQLALDAKRLQSDRDALLVGAAASEDALRNATERAEAQAVIIAQLRKKNIEAAAQAEDFLSRLQTLTQEHEGMLLVHGRAQRELSALRGQQEESDKEVQRLRFELAAVPSDMDFRVSSVGMSLPRAQFNVMAVLYPSQFQKEEEGKKQKKQIKRVVLQTQLERALESQKQMQDQVDKARSLVEEKDKEIKALNLQAVRLEGEYKELEEKQAELQCFKDADDQGFRYVAAGDIAEAALAAAAAGPQEGLPRVVRRSVLGSLLEKLRKIARAALDEATQ